MKRFKKSLPVFFLLIVFIIFHYFGVSKIANITLAAYPTLIMFIAYFICVVILLGEYTAGEKTEKTDQAAKKTVSVNYFYVFSIIVLLIIYLLSISHAGFVLTSALFLFVLFLLWRIKRVNLELRYIVISALLSIGFPALVSFIFEKILMTRLP
jgi:TRAP-type uncharacterized transport system fused permease subunit